MLVEIPDPDIIFSVIVAFLVGLFGLYVFYKVKPIINLKNSSLDPSYLSKLEHYEKQLIDMKIRLDSLVIDDNSTKSDDSQEELKKILQNLVIKENVSREEEKVKPVEPILESKSPIINQNNTSDYVLQLITKKPMTSRDIQITLNKSREHTSRLMKKLFDDGYVQRNTSSKPYTYSITNKGKERLGLVEASLTVS